CPELAKAHAGEIVLHLPYRTRKTNAGRAARPRCDVDHASPPRTVWNRSRGAHTPTYRTGSFNAPSVYLICRCFRRRACRSRPRSATRAPLGAGRGAFSYCGIPVSLTETWGTNADALEERPPPQRQHSDNNGC